MTITIGAGGAGSAHGTAAGDAAGVGTDTFIGGVNSATGSNFADIYNATGFIIGTSTFNAFQGQGRQRHHHRQRQHADPVSAMPPPA